MQLPSFSSASVLVVGDVMLDRYWTGSTQRISPEAPVPVVRISASEDRLGGAGNVAANIAGLGATTKLVGLVGEDEAGRVVAELANAAGIEHRLEPVPGRPTVTKLRVLSRHQQLLRMDFEQPANPSSSQSAAALAEHFIEGFGALVISDYAKGSLGDCSRLISIARERKIPVIVDPKGMDWEKYRGATLITPNLSEFQSVAGYCQTDEELVERATALCEKLDLGAILITLSERGMLLAFSGGDPLQIATQAREVFDVTGAGDTVVGVLAACLAAGCSLAEATRLANLAAGIVVGKLGAASVSPEDLSRSLASTDNATRLGVLSQEELLQQVAAARQRGETLVMTNGCFDLLHPGHIRYLQAAAELGDRLIVAVNSDASVKRLKGSARPLNTLQDRMAMLSALQSVDWVVDFDEDTPAELISRILPDLLIKGGDYRPEDIAGYQEVTSAGGEVRVLPYEQGYSTTSLLERVRQDS